MPGAVGRKGRARPPPADRRPVPKRSSIGSDPENRGTARVWFGRKRLLAEDFVIGSAQLGGNRADNLVLAARSPDRRRQAGNGPEDGRRQIHSLGLGWRSRRFAGGAARIPPSYSGKIGKNPKKNLLIPPQGGFG